MALDILSRIHTIPTVPIVDCFQKIRQQVKCYLQLAGVMGKNECMQVTPAQRMQAGNASAMQAGNASAANAGNASECRQRQRMQATPAQRMQVMPANADNASEC